MDSQGQTPSSDPRALPDAFEVDRLASSLKERLFGGDKQTVDRYVVLEQLGRGGMGLVYRAFDPRVERVVALKVTRIPEGSTHQQRLAQEARLLGRLNHPNVLTVFDVGIANEHVYIATELVEGGDLARWCAERPDRDRPTVRKILEFALQAAEGLAAAHGAGLVHRDVKPSNLLIDSNARLRVADFGLARDAEPSDASIPAGVVIDSGSDTPLTATGTVLGTPAYMAPEQYRGAADALSDQFSWAVTFWEALFGARPYTPEVLAAAGGDLPAPAAPTSGAPVPKWMLHALRRALASEAAQRFTDMDEVASVLRKGLRGGGRSRVVGLVGVLTVGLVAGGLAARTDEAVPCTGSEQSLEGVWDETQRERVLSHLLTSELAYAPRLSKHVGERLDAWSEAFRAQHRDACEATLVRAEQTPRTMDARMRCLAGRKRIVAAKVDVLSSLEGDEVSRASRIVDDLPDVGRCADLEFLGSVLPPPEDPETAAEVERIRDELAKVAALRGAGRYADAVELAEATLSDADASGYLPVHAEAQLEMGRQQGHHLGRTHALREAVLLADRAGDQPVVMSAASLLAQRLAEADADRAWPKESLWFARRAEAVAEQLGRDDPRTRARLDDSMGRALMVAGELDESFARFERSVEARREIYGSQSPSLARGLNSLGLAKGKAGRLEESQKHFEAAIAIWDESLGLEHPEATNAMHNLGMTLVQLGRDEEALDLHKRALAVRERVFGPYHTRVANSLSAIGGIYRRRGENEHAIDVLTRALEVHDHNGGRQRRDAAALLLTLANVHSYNGDFVKGMATYREALGILEAIAPHDPGISRVHYSMGIAYSKSGDDAQAETQMRAVLDTEVSSGRPVTDMRIRAMYELGVLARRKSELDESGKVFEEAIDLARDVDIPPNLWGKLWFGYAQTQWKLGREDDARRSAQKAIGHFEASENYRARAKIVEQWLTEHS